MLGNYLSLYIENPMDLLIGFNLLSSLLLSNHEEVLIASTYIIITNYVLVH